MGTTFWLNIWSDQKLGNASESKYRDLYLGVYGGLGAAQTLSMLILSIVVAICTLNASKKMHKNMLSSVLHCPMSFFDTTPLGRIVNRFAKDIDVCDNTLPMNIQQMLSTIFSVSKNRQKIDSIRSEQ